MTNLSNFSKGMQVKKKQTKKKNGKPYIVIIPVTSGLLTPMSFLFKNVYVKNVKETSVTHV